MAASNHRFRAFISYSKRDKRHAKRLHKALESYRIPKDVEAPGIIDPKTRRLGRFFRDDEEMGAATDLGNELRGALADSENLIVICSPHAAQSKWVNDEIVHFKLTGRKDRIFATIVAGEPNASQSGNSEIQAKECFPKALRFEIDNNGQITDQPTEPLGLDTRIENFSRLRVRLAAGLLNIPFDQLWRRDRRRAHKIRNVAAIATSIIGIIGIAITVSVMEAYNLDRSRYYGAIALQALERDNVNTARRLVLIASRTPWFRPVPHEVDTALSRISTAYKKNGEKVRYVHENEFNYTNFNEENSRIIAWDEQGQASLWDSSNGELISEIQHNVKSSKFMKDGSEFLTWGEDNTLQLWNAHDGTLSLSFRHDGWIIGAKTFENEQRILSWSKDDTAKIWNASSGELLTTLEHEYFLRDASIGNNNSRVLTRTWTSARLWDAESGELVATLKQDLYVSGAEFTQDGDRVLTWGSNSIRLHDANSGSELLKLDHSGYKLGAIIDSKATRILSWAEDGTIKLWDAVDGNLITETDNRQKPHDAIFVDSQSYILIQDINNTTQLLSAVEGDLVARFKHNGDIRNISNQSGTRYISWHDNIVEIRDPIQGRLIASLEHEQGVLNAVSNRIETRILTQSSDGTVRLWNADNNIQIAMLHHDARTDGAIFSRNGAKVLSWSKDKSARLWDAIDGSLIAVFRNEGDVNSAKFSNAETSVVSIGNKMVTVWNASDNDPAGYIQQRDVRGILVDKYKSKITTWLWGDSLNSWDWASGKMIYKMQHDGLITGVVSNKDDSLLLSWSDDSTARIWNSEDGSLLHMLQHGDWVEGALFLKDDSQILTWSLDNTAKIWNAGSGSEIITLNHGAPITDVIISDDERNIITLGFDEIVRVWNTSGTVIAALLHDSPPRGAVLNKSGSRLATWNHINSVNLWNIASGTQIANLPQDGPVIGANFSQSGSLLITWSARDARLWSSASGTPIINVQTDSTILYAFMPDEKTILTRSTDSLQIWSAVNGSSIGSIEQELLTGAILNKSGKRILTWNNSTVMIWNLADGGKISSRMISGTVSSATFSPDETEILVWNEDGDLQRWDVEHEMDNTTRMKAKLSTIDIGLCELGVSAKRITVEDIILAGLPKSEIGKNVCLPRRGMGNFMDRVRNKKWQSQQQ